MRLKVRLQSHTALISDVQYNLIDTDTERHVHPSLGSTLPKLTHLEEHELEQIKYFPKLNHKVVSLPENASPASLQYCRGTT